MSYGLNFGYSYLVLLQFNKSNLAQAIYDGASAAGVPNGASQVFWNPQSDLLIESVRKELPGA